MTYLCDLPKINGEYETIMLDNHIMYYSDELEYIIAIRVSDNYVQYIPIDINNTRN